MGRWLRDAPPAIFIAKRPAPSVSPVYLVRQVRDGLDIVAIRIEHEGSVIIGVIVRPQPRRAVVTGTGGYSSVIKRHNLFAIFGRKGDVQASLICSPVPIQNCGRVRPKPA